LLEGFPANAPPRLPPELRNNPPDVVFSAFSQAFFKGAIRMFQRDSEMKNIVLADATARDQAIRHFFGRALREAREDARPS
jgi:type I restriction enzyme, R subunit